MSLSNLLHHPRRIWLRKAIFQVHLWTGLLLALYLFVIALSGSILVFKDELIRWQLPSTLHSGSPSQPEQILQKLHAANPGITIRGMQLPSPVLPAYLLDGKDAQGRPTRWIADPVTGEIFTAPRTWIDWTLDLHYYLLLPHSWGMQANGAGAIGLLLLAVTGILLWWPGTKLWRRALGVSLRAGRRRINYDLHSSIGFWTLAIVLWWGRLRRLLRLVPAGRRRHCRLIAHPRHGLTPTRDPSAPRAPGSQPSLAAIIAAAQAASPNARIWSISDPDLRTSDSFILLDRAAPGDFSHRDIVRIRTADDRVLSIWRYGQNQTLGDWFLWAMHPLHFGTLWGLGIKVLWALLGLTLAILTLTGTLIYWNRYLRTPLEDPHTETLKSFGTYAHLSVHLKTRSGLKVSALKTLRTFPGVGVKSSSRARPSAAAAPYSLRRPLRSCPPKTSSGWRSQSSS